jgi:hypothetical protein
VSSLVRRIRRRLGWLTAEEWQARTRLRIKLRGVVVLDANLEQLHVFGRLPHGEDEPVTVWTLDAIGGWVLLEVQL